MKTRAFFCGMLTVFIIELAVVILFSLSKAGDRQDTVAVNEIVQTVQNSWNALEDHVNPTAMD